MNRHDKRILGIWGLVVILWLSLLYCFMHWVYIPKMCELNGEQQQFERQLSSYKAQQQQAGSADKLKARLDKRQKLLSSVLPAKLNGEDFCNRLTNIALATKATIIGVTPETAVKRDGYTEQVINLKLQGDFFQNLAFLQHLALVERLVTIKSSSMKVENAIILTNISLQIYSYNYNG